MNDTITIYNKSDHRVRQMIDGEILVVPVNGSLVTSVQKGLRLLGDHGGELTRDPDFRLRSLYDEEDFAALDRLGAPALRKLLRVVMAGNKADVKAALADLPSAEK
jgi:hypothetical protein